jgi:hypothetical protein
VRQEIVTGWAEPAQELFYDARVSNVGLMARSQLFCRNPGGEERLSRIVGTQFSTIVVSTLKRVQGYQTVYLSRKQGVTL